MKNHRGNIILLFSFIVFWIAAFAQTFDEMEDPETGQTVYREGGKGPDKPCFNPQGKPIPCPHDINVPLDNKIGLALLFVAAAGSYYYLRRARAKATQNTDLF